MALQRSRELPAEQRAAQLEQEHADFLRRQRKWWAVRLAGLVASVAIGLVFMAIAFRLTDRGWANIAFWGGLLAGNTGVSVTLLWTYLKALEDGDL